MRRFLTLASILPLSEAATAHDGATQLGPRGIKPRYGFDPATIKSCSLWYDNDGSISCENMPASWDITEEQWKRWNPSLAASCDAFVVQKSYCIEASGDSSGPEPSPEPEKQIPDNTSTSETADVPTTPAKPGNGIETPSPIQPGMVDNCNDFYKVVSGDNCQGVSSKKHISLDDFLTWNPQVGGRSCSGLWAGAYVCVSVIGHQAPTGPPAHDGTPSPVQEGIVKNCSKFHKVERGESCIAIAKGNGVAVEDFMKWNPSLGADCRNMFAEYYVCVGIPGYKKSEPSPGHPGSTQPGIVENCVGYHRAVAGDTCWGILNNPQYKDLTSENFHKWNPALRPDCSGLLAGYDYCIRIQPAFHIRSYYHTGCTGDVNGEVTVTPDSDGVCLNTNCGAASLDIAASGLCPDGQVQISYWEKPGCGGKWFGYGYGSRGTCRVLWTEGWKFKAVHLRCARQQDDCVSQGQCTVDQEPAAYVC